MRFASLGSGSEGNGLLVQVRDTARARPISLLVDCGFGLREAERRLRSLGVEPGALSAILVTHEHGDHVGGVFRLARAHHVPVYLTHGTLQATSAGKGTAGCRIELIEPDSAFQIEGLAVEPVPVPHDAREPVQFVFDSGQARLGVLTDLGHASAHVLRAFSGLDAIVLECNHDPALLEANPRYPPALKRRISGPYGHLSNGSAAGIARAIRSDRLRRVVAAHLSAHNNRPELAKAALATALDVTPGDILIAEQQGGLAWLDVGLAMAG